MMVRFSLFATLSLALVASTATIAAPARKAASPLAPKAVVLPDVVRVALTTSMGTIVIDLDHKNAPVTTANFVRYVDAKRFDGISFYRVMRLDFGPPQNGLIQGGLQNDPKRIYPPIAHEPTYKTGMRHSAGTISMARFAPGTATAYFTILVSDMYGLDAGAKGQTDTEGFAAFGRVFEGMDVVRKIYEAQLSPTKGDGFLKGQMLEQPVRIVTARRLASPATSPVLQVRPVVAPAIPQMPTMPAQPIPPAP